jgi:hypothetical protein
MTDLPGAVLQARRPWLTAETDSLPSGSAPETPRLSDAALEAVSGPDRVPRRGYLLRATFLRHGELVEHVIEACCRPPRARHLSDVGFQGKDPETALPSFRPRHRVHACGALNIFPLRALDVDQIAE